MEPVFSVLPDNSAGYGSNGEIPEAVEGAPDHGYPGQDVVFADRVIVTHDEQLVGVVIRPSSASERGIF